jgi:hypothetical protein
LSAPGKTESWRACVPAGPAIRARREVDPGVVIGADRVPVQRGLLGRWSNGPVAFDLAGCHTISLFGVQGFGKSYTLGTIAEMATMPIGGVNVLPQPLAALVFHYHRSENYPPELLAARVPTDDPFELRRLRESGLEPQGLPDVVLLAPSGKVAARRAELPDVDVQPIFFAPHELGAEGWRLLMGASGNDALYLRQLVSVLRKRRDRLDLAGLRADLEAADLSPPARRLVDDRLALAEEYLSTEDSLGAVFRPGRTVIVDLRDEWIEKDEALVLFIVLMRIFARASGDGTRFNRLVVFDEAHKYFGDSDMIAEVVETIREARHQGTSVVIASQDPLSIPRAVIELSSTLILHRLTSPLWLKHLKGAISSLEAVTDQEVGTLQPGEALVWSQRATDRRFTERPQKVWMRTRVTKHGGATRIVGAAGADVG